MAQMLIRESSDLGDDTADDFELEQENVQDVEQHGRKIFLSGEVVDRRLVEVYKQKRWREDYKTNKGTSKAFHNIQKFMDNHGSRAL